jgi:enoyl-CoA hydratase/carnithine racemase
MQMVKYEQRDGIGYITLDRPEKMNAISDAMSEELREAFYRLDDDRDALVGIISGNGRAFCTGADVQQRQLGAREEMERIGGPGGRSISAALPLYRSTNFKPIIASVHGYVMGLGLLLAFVSDVLVASEGTRFQITEVRRGLNGGFFWGLLSQRGWASFADDVAITGRFWFAEEAAAKGVVQYLAKPGEHLKIAEDVAVEIKKNPPLAVRAIVRQRRANLEALDAQAYGARSPNLHLTEDFRESALAFVEKRTPVFRGQ